MDKLVDQSLLTLIVNPLHPKSRQCNQLKILSQMVSKLHQHSHSFESEKIYKSALMHTIRESEMRRKPSCAPSVKTPREAFGSRPLFKDVIADRL